MPFFTIIICLNYYFISIKSNLRNTELLLIIYFNILKHFVCFFKDVEISDKLGIKSGT